MNRRRVNGMLRKMTFSEREKQELKKLRRTTIAQSLIIRNLEDSKKYQKESINNLQDEIERIKKTWWYKIIIFIINIFKKKRG